MVVISVYTYGVKIIKKFRWESGFLWGGSMEPPLCTNGSAGYLMQLSVNQSDLSSNLYTMINLKATNNVGIVSAHSYGGYAVDASPPIPGHVYDGNPGLITTAQKDQDFQTHTTTLHAFWEGFHDPHSSLIGYWWKAGTCQGCDDVLPEQYVGLQTSMF